MWKIFVYAHEASSEKTMYFGILSCFPYD